MRATIGSLLTARNALTSVVSTMPVSAATRDTITAMPRSVQTNRVGATCATSAAGRLTSQARASAT